MNITKERFVEINKWILYVAIPVYLIGLFTPIQYLQPGLIFVFGAAFFCLFHKDYFAGRLKNAALIWMFPLAITLISFPIPLARTTGLNNSYMFIITFMLSLIPVLVFLLAETDEKPSKKERLPIISLRIVVQLAIFMTWLSVEAFCFIKGTRPDLFFWAMFHVATVALLPFLFGRVICGWICPNSVFQDALFKNMTSWRPIKKLPKAIEEQSRTCAMNISGEIDKRAPLMPATLLLCWFPMFFAETIFDLTRVDWYPIVFFYPLIIFSLLLPWRKLCTHFCWLSSYRGLASNNSLWRIRYNKTKCRQCKRCLAEEACAFYIDIRNQDNEMPTTCCLCFSCMESCPFNDVITFRRDPEEKARLKAEAKAS